MSNPSWVIALVEDERHNMLIYRYLINCGLKRHAITVKKSPSGWASAENWVRREFVRETTEYRRRQARARTALIVIIDADIYTVQDRLNQLDEALKESGKQTVGRSEQIARLVPKRNVETWILCLCNEEPVSEEEDYKNRRNDWNELIPPAARTLCQRTRSSTAPPNHCVSSLRIGVRELKRLRF
jgi:hypothetical protein